MTKQALVGDIGGTNSRFGLVEPGLYRGPGHRGPEEPGFRVARGGHRPLPGRAGRDGSGSGRHRRGRPHEGEVVALTNRDWRFTRESLAQGRPCPPLFASSTTSRRSPCRCRISRAMTWSRLVARRTQARRQDRGSVPETGLGMATLAPLPQGGWMALPGEVGHITLPVATRRNSMAREDVEASVPFESEDCHHRRRPVAHDRSIADNPVLSTPEAVLQAALAGSDAAAVKTLDQFITWLARIAGDAAMTMQARGTVSISPAASRLPSSAASVGDFRAVFRRRDGWPMSWPHPVYVIVDRFPAFKGCAAAIAEGMRAMVEGHRRARGHRVQTTSALGGKLAVPGGDEVGCR